MPPKLQKLFDEPKAFIQDVVALCEANDLGGINLDFETGRGTSTPQLSAALAAFTAKLGDAMHAVSKDLRLSIDVVSDPNGGFWNHSLLNSSTGLDFAADMGSYSESFAEFVVNVGRMLQEYWRMKIGTGLCPGCLKTPFSADELRARVDAISEAGIANIDIWEIGALPDTWIGELKRYISNL